MAIERYLIEFASFTAMNNRLFPIMFQEEETLRFGFRLQVDHLWQPEDFADKMHVIVTVAGAPYTDAFGKVRQAPAKGVIRGRLYGVERMRGNADKILLCYAEFPLMSEPERWSPKQQIIQTHEEPALVQGEGIPQLTVCGMTTTEEANIAWELPYDEDQL